MAYFKLKLNWTTKVQDFGIIELHLIHVILGININKKPEVYIQTEGSKPPGKITSGYRFPLKYWYGPPLRCNWTLREVCTALCEINVDDWKKLSQTPPPLPLPTPDRIFWILTCLYDIKCEQCSILSLDKQTFWTQNFDFLLTHHAVCNIWCGTQKNGLIFRCFWVSTK